MRSLSLISLLVLSGLVLAPTPAEPLGGPAAAGPDIEITPSSLDTELCPDGAAERSLTLCNVGDAPLDWALGESPGGRRGPGCAPAPVALEIDGGPAAPEDMALVLDDGSRENDIGVGGTVEFLWANRFTPSPLDFPFMLVQIQVYFSSAGLVSIGDAITLAVYENTSGGSDPAPGSTFLASLPATVEALDAWNVYDLPAPVVLNGPGDVILAVIGLEMPGTSYWPAALDETLSQHRSWAGWWNSSPPPDPPLLAPPNWTPIDAYFPGNWMLRGYGECGCCADVPWLSEDLTNGTLVPGECLDVAVTFEAGGRDPGVYPAGLVVSSNDLDEPEVTVPAGMTVLAPPSGAGLAWSPAAPRPGQAVVFTGTVEAGDPPLAFAWDWGDGTAPGSGYTATHAFAGAGSYTVTLAAANDCGMADAQRGMVVAGAPDMQITPPALSETLCSGQAATQPITVCNTGEEPLHWWLEEAEPVAPLPTSPLRSTAPPSDSVLATRSKAVWPSAGAGGIERGSRGAFAIDLSNENLIYFDLDDLGGWTIIAHLPGSLYVGGDFPGSDWRELYLVDAGLNELHTVHTPNGAVTVIGPAVPAGGEAWAGLTGALDGTLYGASTSVGHSTLYTLDLATGAPAVVGAITNGPCIIDIAINAAGEMYGVDICSDVLLRIDPLSGVGTVIGSLGFDANYAQGMDFEPASGALYLAAFNGSSLQGELRLVDVDTGGTTLVGVLPNGMQLDSLAFMPLPLVDVPWLSEVPEAGTLAPGDCGQVQVTVDAAALAPGGYGAGLLFTGNDPLEPSVSVPVSLSVPAPPGEVAFTYSSGPIAGETIFFTATVGSGDPPFSLAWDWGDGTVPGSGYTATHVFAAPGDYAVALAVAGECGSAQAQSTVTVAPPYRTVYLPVVLKAHGP